MDTMTDRTARIQAFTALVDRALRAEDADLNMINARKAVAFQHILEEIARFSPSAVEMIEAAFVPHYQRRLDAAEQKEI